MVAKKRKSKSSAKKDVSQRIPTEEVILNKRRLELEIKERDSNVWWNVSWLGKLVKLGPLITIFVLGFWYLAQWNVQIKQQKLESVNSLIGQLTSENHPIRTRAARALADYPKEAIPILIYSLGSINPSTKEEDTAFTSAAKWALRQISDKTSYPVAQDLIVELRRVQKERSIEASAANKNCKESLAYILRNQGYRRLELKELDLSGIDLSGADLSGANFSNSNLSNASFLDVDLSHADLSDTDLSNACLYRANLAGTRFIKAILQSANLGSANLTNASFLAADLSRAHLHWANLSGAYLYAANFSGANLECSNMSEVKAFENVNSFDETNLFGVRHLTEKYLGYAKSKGAIFKEPDNQERLSGADLSGAYLSGADLRGFDLSDANLSKANLTGADLFWADISCASLRQANLTGANLWRIRGFMEVKDFSGTILEGVKDLSREYLEYAKSKGAITD